MMSPSGNPPGEGATFFDHNRRNLGWATRVLRRKPSLGGLTVLDVSTAEPRLAASLRALDKDPLFVSGDRAGNSLTFAWASGYENGGGIRIQGVLRVK